MKKLYVLFILLSNIILVSCSGSDSNEEGGVVIGKSILNATPSSINIAADGSQQTLTITANCDWTISGATQWLTISTLSGNNNATITLSATQNTSIESRSCTLSLIGGNLKHTITVKQNGASASAPSESDNGTPDY